MSNYRRAYLEGGTYFFTVTLSDRNSKLLIDQIDLLRLSYRSVQEEWPFRTIAICVMPDHIHAVWQLPLGDSSYSKRWQRIKARFSKALPASSSRSGSKRRKREKGIWQRRFWEHLIRDEDDLERYVDYIHYNPVKHGYVPSVKDWPYSSFHRYVRCGRLPGDWGGSTALESDTRRYGE